MFNYQGMTEQYVREGVQKFQPAVGARKVIDQEYLHAQESIEMGIYVTYSCQMKKSECFRIGSTSKCFCGHLFSSHKQNFFGKKFNTACEQCPCKMYKFVPIRPEECGMYWLTRRKDFNITKWRPPCKCNHNCEEHDPNYPLRCRKCTCSEFQSYFACISCDQKWEDHEVLYESDQERIQMGKKIGKQYLPLSQNPDIQFEVFKDNRYELDKYEGNMIQQQQQQIQQRDPNLKPFILKKPPVNINQIQLQTKQQPYTTAYTRQRPKSQLKIQKK